MTDYSPPLDALASALAVLDEAQAHGYCRAAAYDAAYARLAGLEAEQLHQAGAALAALAAEFGVLVSWTRGGHRPAFNIDGWVRLARCQVAAEEEP